MTLYRIISNFCSLRTVKEASPKSKEKFKQTCFEKYGVSNVSQTSETKLKKAQTFLKHYGVDNVFKTSEFKQNLTDHMLQKYGVKRVTAQMLKAFKPKTEKLVEKYLIQMDIPYAHSFYMAGRQYDFLLPDAKLLIEVNGDFWHANPIFYKEDDILPHQAPTGYISAKALWERDEKKKNLAMLHGYNVMYIWENELKTIAECDIIKTINYEYENCKIAFYEENKV